MKSGMEWQVSNVELSKKLKELGVKQESYFQYWTLLPANGHPRGETQLVKAIYEDSIISECISAFTCSELGEMLPQKGDPNCNNISLISTMRFPIDYDRADYRGKWACLTGGRVEVLASTEADARALMIILLIETGVVKP